MTAAPRAISPKERFSVTVAADRAPTRVTLLAPNAVTHGQDMNQRFVELRVERAERRGARWRLTVTGPRSLAAMPPGPAMLFALSPRGAPSVARWTTVR